MNDVFSIKTVAKMLGVEKKELLEYLIKQEIITASHSVIDGSGYVAELYVYHTIHVETTLLITAAGVNMLIKEVYHG